MNSNAYRNEIKRKLRANGVPEEHLDEDADGVIRALNCSLPPADIHELSMIATKLQLMAMKLQTAHNNNSSTAQHDLNHSVTLMKLKKAINVIHDFYAKEM